MNKYLLIPIILFFIACDDTKIAMNSQAPEILAKTTGNKSIKLNRNGIELVQFWENGCAACLKVMASLDEFAKEKNIQIYAINSIDDIKIIKKHELEHNYTNITFLKDSQDISWSRYEIFAVPTLFIVKDGVLVDKILGDRGFNYIKERLERYL